MTLREGVVNFDGSLLHYQVAGEGPEVLLVFHGFGLDGKTMLHWLAPLQKKYTLVLVDLFFHKQSVLQPKHQPLSREVWVKMIEKLLALFPGKPVSLLGYSLGCKFVQTLWADGSHKWDKIFMLAPDGICENPWYTVATRTWISRQIFKFLAQQPGWLFALMNVAGKLRLVKSSILKFAGSQLNTQTKRQNAYEIWVNFRKQGLKGEKWIEAMKRRPTHIQILVGKWDRVIVARQIRKKLKKTPGVHVKELPTGHNEIVKVWVASLSPGFLA